MDIDLVDIDLGRLANQTRCRSSGGDDRPRKPLFVAVGGCGASRKLAGLDRRAVVGKWIRASDPRNL